MEWLDQGKLRTAVQKYRYVLVVVLAGILLMAIPEERKEVTAPPENSTAEAPSALEERLSLMLSQVEGAGKVRVLLTEAKGQQTVYEMNVEQRAEETRRQTVLIQRSDRGETGLVRQINPPVYQGALVLCQGAASARVRLLMIQAVSSVTGLGADKVTVLKME